MAGAGTTKGPGVERSDESLVTPLVRGAISAAVCLGAGLALLVVPALAVQLSAGGSSLSVLEALVLALNILVLAHGGSLELTTGVVDGAVSLTPLGLTALFVLINALGARHAAHMLRPIGSGGALRPRALRDLGAALGAQALIVAIGLTVLGALGRSPDLRPVLFSAFVSGAFVAVLGGALGILWALRREVHEVDESVRVLELLSAPYGALLRGTGIAVLGLIVLGFAAVALMTLIGIRQAAALQDTLDAGVIGGIVLTLLQIALLPLFAVWALVVLLGGTVSLGTGTAYSLDAVDSGVMPALPWLATLPPPGDHPDALRALVLLPAAAIALGAVAVVRETVALERRERILAWSLYPVAVTVAVLLIAGLATGGIGAGRLQHLGPQLGTLLLPLLLSAALVTGIALVVMASPVPAMIRSGIATVRAKVESEEAEERAERSGRTLPAVGATAGSAAEGEDDPGETSGEPTEPAVAESASEEPVRAEEEPQQEQEASASADEDERPAQ